MTTIAPSLYPLSQARRRYGELALRFHALPLLLYRVDRHHVYEQSFGMSERIRAIGDRVDGMVTALANPRFRPSVQELAALEALLLLEDGCFTVLANAAGLEMLPLKEDEYRPEIGARHCPVIFTHLHQARTVAEALQHGLTAGTYRWNGDADIALLGRTLERLDMHLAYFHHAMMTPEVLHDLPTLLRHNCDAAETMNAMVKRVIATLDVSDASLTDAGVLGAVPSEPRHRVGRLAQRYRRLSTRTEYQADYIQRWFCEMHHRPANAVRTPARLFLAALEHAVRMLADADYLPALAWLESMEGGARQWEARDAILDELVQFRPWKIYEAKGHQERWYPYALDYVSCLGRIERLAEGFFSEWQSHGDSRMVAAVPNARYYLDEARQQMKADLAAEAIPPFDRLRRWSVRMERAVDHLVFGCIDPLLLPGGSEPFADGPATMPPKDTPPIWGGTAIH